MAEDSDKSPTPWIEEGNNCSHCYGSTSICLSLFKKTKFCPSLLGKENQHF